MILRCISSLVFVLLLGGRAIGSSEITIQISPLRATYVYGEPIILNLVVTNTGAISKTVTLGYNAEEDIIFLSDNKLYHYSGKDKSGISKGAVLHMNPGRQYRELLLLNNWTGVVSEGTHTFKVSTAKDPNVSSSFSLQVTGADPEQLKRRVVEAILTLNTTKNASDAKVIRESLRMINSTQSKTFVDDVLSSLDPASIELFKKAIISEENYD